MEIQSYFNIDFDPGPVDQSVLVWQHEHRSAAIWEDEVPPRELTCRHKLLGMRDWPLDPRVCNYLIEFGLYGVYKVAFIQLDYALITALVERWRPETHTFHLPVGETTITLQDVNVLLGLRVDGPAVTGSTKYNWADLCEDLLGLRPGLKDLHGSHISLGWLRDNFRNLPPDADGETLKRYTRAFVLALMSGFLFGDKSKHDVALTFLPLLRDFDEVAQLSWGSATLALLYRELCRASKRTVSTICGPLVLLQLWAWERLHVGRPGRLKDVGASYMEGIDGPLPDPLGCRWRASLSHKENPRGGLDFYRDQFDQQKDDQVIWQPFTRALLEKLPPICLSGQNIWRTIAPLICFDVVEWHRPDRVLRQFGFRQPIPSPCDNEKALHAIDKRGKSEYDWSARHSRHIELWEARQSTVVTGEPENVPMDYLDPYMDWYRRITRKIISPLKERRPGQFQPNGFTFQLLIQKVATIHARCKATLDDALTVDTARLALQEIYDICAGTLQVTSPLVSLSNGSPYQAPTPEPFAMLAQPSASDTNKPLGALASHTLDTETAQKSLSTDVVIHTSTEFSGAPLETLPPVQVLEAEPSLSSSAQKPLSWPSGGKLTFSWICDIMLSFDWSSRNLPPTEFASVLSVHVLDDLVLSASKILKKEPNCVKIDSRKAKVVVVGDLHGQLHDLLFLLQDAGFPDDDQFYVFNGNYVDKGAWGLETFLLLLAWKVFLPGRVFLLRGNHESESCTSVYGFRNEVLTKYGEKGLHVYKKCLECFQLLPLGSVIAGKIFTAHGGLFRSHLKKYERNRKRKRIQKKQADGTVEIEPEVESVPLGSLEELSRAKRRVLDPSTKGSNLILGDILWSVPMKEDGVFPNKEIGMGLFWGPDCTKKFLEDNHLKVIVRGHEGPDVRQNRVGFAPMDEGYARDHEGLITLFSAPDYPQFQDTENRCNNKGAYLIFQIPEVEEPEIHSFEAVTPRPKAEAYYSYKNAAYSLENFEYPKDRSMVSPTAAGDVKNATDSGESSDSEPMEVDDKDAVDSAELLEYRNDEAVHSETPVTNDIEMTDSFHKLENGISYVIDSETAAASNDDLAHHVKDVPSKEETVVNSEPAVEADEHATHSDSLDSKTGLDPEKMIADFKNVVDSVEATECVADRAFSSKAVEIQDTQGGDSAEKLEFRSGETDNPEPISASEETATGCSENLEQAKEKECTVDEGVGPDAERPESMSVNQKPTATGSISAADSPKMSKCTRKEDDSSGKLVQTTSQADDSEPMAADAGNEDEGKANKANETESTAAGHKNPTEKLESTSEDAKDISSESESAAERGSDPEILAPDNKDAKESETGTKEVVTCESPVADDKDKSKGKDQSEDKS